MSINQGVEFRTAYSYEGSTSYNSGIIERFADKLDSRAPAIVSFYVLLDLLFGAGAAVAANTKSRNEIAGWVIGAVIIIISFCLRQQRAFQLRLQAQFMPCQMHIEKNAGRAWCTYGSSD